MKADTMFADALADAVNEEMKRHAPEHVSEAARNIVHGPGGFLQWERREVIYHVPDRETALARFILMWLSNPYSESAEAVLMEILDQRAKMIEAAP